MSDDTDKKTLEQKAFQDLDAIALISKHALCELDAGDLDGLEDTIRSIHDHADAWHEPDADEPDLPPEHDDLGPA
jgi:hypothetical protein